MQLQAPGELRTLLQGVSWSTYESLLADLGEHRGRIAYDNRMLEIVTPSGTQEGLKRIIGRLVETFSLGMGMEILSTSALTPKRIELLKGAEAGESYHVQNEHRVRHKLIDLAPTLPLEEFCRFLEKRNTLTENQLVSAFRDRVREHFGAAGVERRKSKVDRRKKKAGRTGRGRKPNP